MELERPTFTEDEAYTAMCLWEAVADANDTAPWINFRRGNGTHALRDAVLGLAKACDADFDAIKDDYGLAFDWDFCPLWLAECVDWTGLPSLRSESFRNEWLAQRKED